jgi:RNA polymerase sigma factor (sigma-70 family)
MANNSLHHVLRFIRRTRCAPNDPDSDGRLLERFVAGHDGEAFAALMQRHGALVFGVCRHVLADYQQAEDAFQATFLVLARKAGSVRSGEALSGWLGRVAFRVALRARKQAAPLRVAESLVVDVPQANASSEVEPDLNTMLAEEIGRLPEKYRTLVALCYWQGRTYQEAAALLGRPPGTVAGWLARARQLLRHRLVKRGLMPSVATAAVGASSAPATAETPALLCAMTVKAALALTRGEAVDGASARAVVLMEGVVRSMSLNSIKFFAVLLLAFGVAGTVTAVALRGSPRDPPGPMEQPRPAAQLHKNSRKPEPDASAPRLEVKVAVSFQHGGHVSAILFSPDGDRLITAGNDGDPQIIGGQVYNGRVKMWNLPKEKEEKAGLSPFLYGVDCAALSPDGKSLAVATTGYLLGPGDRPTVAEPGELVVFDTTGKKPPVRLKGQSVNGHRLAFSPDGKTLAVAGSLRDRSGLEKKPGGAVGLWDWSKGKEVELKGHKGYVRAVAFSPDGKLLASSSGIPPPKPPGAWKGELKLWDLTTNKEKATLEGIECDVWCVAFSPDGKTLASGNIEGVIRLWDLATEKETATLKGHTGPVVTLSFSPDGTLLASGGGDASSGELKLWDVPARKEKEALTGHKQTVNALAFDRKGKKLASADSEGVVQIWSFTLSGNP